MVFVSFVAAYLTHNRQQTTVVTVAKLKRLLSHFAWNLAKTYNK